MPRTAAYIVAWFVAGVLAVTLASVGVSMVSDQVTGERPAPLTAGEVTDELASPGGSSGPSRRSTVAADGPTTTTVAARGTDDGPTAGAVDTPPATVPIGAGPSSSGSGSPTTVTTVPAPASAVTRTYPMVGGTATLRFTSGGVAVLTAVPSAGFSVEISEGHDGGARVEFRSDGHDSRVDAWWDGGPQDEVREDD